MANRQTRRSFLQTTAAAATASMPYWFTSAQPETLGYSSASERPVLGCIGTGSRWNGVGPAALNFSVCAAVCDVDANHAGAGKDKVTDIQSKKGLDQEVAVYEDYRKILDREDIDVVTIVTPDHWHIKIAVEALEAGKHVFCQKPLTLTLEENQIIRAAAKKYDKQAFLIGTQQRSDRNKFMRAVNMVQKGLIGDVTKITVGINGSPKGGPFPVEDVPPNLDWDMWLGQAPKVDYRKRRCHYEFRWWYEYSGGKFTDWGAHHVDIAQWALGEDTQGKGPVTIDGTDAKHPVPFKDGYPERDDSYNTSNDFAILCTFPSGVEMNVTSRGDNGILFEGEKGKLFVNRGKITGTPIEENWDKDQFTDEDVVALYKGKPHEGHKDNFYRCIREGGLPVSDVFSHLITMNTCHLTAIAARLGRSITWDPAAEAITGDDQAQAMTARTPRAGYEIPRI